jgi:hypothetical protein
MGQLHLILFTLLWTIVWVAPVPRLSSRVELLAGLLPFVAFGLRVFAGFFAGVPADDPVRVAVSPLLKWVAGDSGAIPYAVVLDATVLWFTGPLPVERQAAVASVVALATGVVAGLVAWLACGFTRTRSRWLFAMAVGVAAGAAVAARHG